MNVLVVISYYNARPATDLLALLDNMQRIESGWPFATRVVVNQAQPLRLTLDADHSGVEVLHRQNDGYNIGAWEYGWRMLPMYDAYLFLQDECRLVRHGWLEAFVRKASEPGIGLVGERLAPPWDRTWEVLSRKYKGHRLPDHLVDGQPADRMDCYFDFFRRHRIAPGLKGDHLQSLVWFARREVLEAVNGFPVGRNYGEAIAAEIGMSKKVQALGLAIATVGSQPFWCFQHPQWLDREAQHQALHLSSQPAPIPPQ